MHWNMKSSKYYLLLANVVLTSTEINFQFSSGPIYHDHGIKFTSIIHSTVKELELCCLPNLTKKSIPRI